MTAELSTAEVTRLEIASEQRYVDQIYARLQVLAEHAQALAHEGRGRADTMADLGGVREEHVTGLFERDVLVHHAARRVAVLDAQHEGLVFGRLDHQDGQIHYIGRIGVRDEHHEPMVLDWRAPAGSVFYQATAIEPYGVVRRRVLRCRGERVIGVEDDLLDADHRPTDLAVVGEGALMAALTAARGDAMRDIVATIQAEQDEIIRAPTRGVTLIGGGPGTGKTVVALHRIAYLLYADRHRFESGGVLVVGPSTVFMDYIERVLPALGETSATLRAIGEIVDGVRATRRDPPACAAIKGSLRMRRILTRAVRDAAPGAPEELRLFAGGRSLHLGHKELHQVRQEVLRRGTRRNRGRADAARALVSALWRQLDESTREELALDEFEAEVTQRSSFRAFVRDWWPLLTPTQVLTWLADPTRLARYASRLLRPAEVELLLASWRPASSRDAGDAGDAGAAGGVPDAIPGAIPGWELSVADVALLDELDALLGTAPPPADPDDAAEDAAEVDAEDAAEVDDAAETDDAAEVSTAADREYAPGTRVASAQMDDRYTHILVDEAQDLSPMQWRMLGRRGRLASWTIVGDPAQSSWPDTEEATSAMETALGRGTRRRFRLSTNYRNSAEIFTFAAEVARRAEPDLELPVAVRHTQRSPDHHIVAGEQLAGRTRLAVRELLAELDGTVAVIVVETRVWQARNWLAWSGNRETDTHTRVRVTTGVDAKGLEYDGVVLVEPAELLAAEPTGARALYVALTRATQRLVTIATGEWLSRVGHSKL